MMELMETRKQVMEAMRVAAAAMDNDNPDGAMVILTTAVLGVLARLELTVEAIEERMREWEQ